MVYYRAPVHTLRGTLTYVTPWQKVCRQAGIGLEQNIPLSRLSKEMVLCLLMAEDRKFFQHCGLDFEEMVLALKDSLLHGKRLRGCSTITQQLAKNFFLTPERSVKRKFKEAIYALKMERTFSKAELLTLYVNNIEWGDSLYGVPAASSFYFHKHPSELTWQEVLFLVSLIPAPRRRGVGFPRSVPEEVWRTFEALTRYLLVLRSYPHIERFLLSPWSPDSERELAQFDLKALQFGSDRANRATLTLRTEALRPRARALRIAFQESLLHPPQPARVLASNE